MTAFFEDLEIGQIFTSAPHAVTTEEITHFARLYDPQDFHTSASTAENTIFGGLIASGWMTAGITMRLMLEAVPKISGGIVGRGIEQLQWPQAVRPGDTLKAEVEILELRPSNSDSARGIARIRTITRNQKGETVQHMESVIFLPRRDQ